MKRLLLALSLALAPAAAHAAGLTIFAAASLTNAMQDIGALWAAAGHPKPVFSFDSSGTLARQIEQGAPANIFASADEKWMDDVGRHDLLAEGTRASLLGNSLVLVEPAGAVKPVTLAPHFEVGAILGPAGRLAVGDPKSVPAGIYAKQALQKLGVWERVADRLAPAASVRAALLLVERGEAPAGIVYGSDAHLSKTVAVAGIFPTDSHEPIRYPFAAIKGKDTQEARDFLHFLHTTPAQDVFKHYGFTNP
jgi:molybdate transport system substrate-binding protein